MGNNGIDKTNDDFIKAVNTIKNKNTYKSGYK
jgi:hypothetical protein